MKIIDNKKDYYDYLIAYNGIDEHVTFDRRASKVIPVDLYGSLYFSKVILYNDKCRTNKRVYCEMNGKYKYQTKLIGLVLNYILEVGYTHYKFEVERYIDDDGLLVINTKLLAKEKIDKKIVENGIVSIIPCTLTSSFFSRYNTVKYHMNDILKCPIMRDTDIPSLITPEEMYDEIYNYILSTKEKPIIDSRNDVQKLQSNGFDKKTSFRKM